MIEDPKLLWVELTEAERVMLRQLLLDKLGTSADDDTVRAAGLLQRMDYRT